MSIIEKRDINIVNLRNLKSVVLIVMLKDSLIHLFIDVYQPY